MQWGGEQHARGGHAGGVPCRGSYARVESGGGRHAGGSHAGVVIRPRAGGGFQQCRGWVWRL